VAQAAPGQERLRDALLELDALTRRLRRDCPWDREQDERSIVPHTVEEAYELADAAHSGDDAKLLDELGDVLFQVYFLALLLEERGGGDLAAVADATRRKLVRRHPHVFGEDEAALAGLPTSARTPADVKRNWDAIKLGEGGGAEIAGGLPALTYARKALKASSAGEVPQALARLQRTRDSGHDSASGAHHGSAELYDAVGELLLAVVATAAELRVDPEIALRRAADAARERGAR
jgi:NTP pyrophosphatase (non-canonical NTP hydrolase)